MSNHHHISKDSIFIVISNKESYELNKEEKETAVRNAIMKLDEIDRQIITMIFYEDLSEGQVAKKLRVSQSAIHQRKAKTFKILQEKLKNYQY